MAAGRAAVIAAKAASENGCRNKCCERQHGRRTNEYLLFH
jgi:hypothetical protein